MNPERWLNLSFILAVLAIIAGTVVTVLVSYAELPQ